MEAKTVDAGLLQSRYRLTKQRAAVLRALGDGKHLSAETILERVRAEMPAVSLGTIYRTLDILREIGLVQIFSFAGSAGINLGPVNVTGEIGGQIEPTHHQYGAYYDATGSILSFVKLHVGIAINQNGFGAELPVGGIVWAC